MLIDVAQFLLDALVETYAGLLLLRFYLQWLRAPMHNPLGEFVILLTNPLVRPTRRIIPSIRMLDTASILLALLVELAFLCATLLLHGHGVGSWLLPVWALLRLLKISIYLLLGALFLEALLSWTNPHAPFAPVLSSLTRPFLRPLRRLVPPKGSLDFSFLILFFLCSLILTVPLQRFEQLIMTAIWK
jgi:YggT family protein